MSNKTLRVFKQVEIILKRINNNIIGFISYTRGPVKIFNFPIETLIFFHYHVNNRYIGVNMEEMQIVRCLFPRFQSLAYIPYFSNICKNPQEFPRGWWTFWCNLKIYVNWKRTSICESRNKTIWTKMCISCAFWTQEWEI